VEDKVGERPINGNLLPRAIDSCDKKIKRNPKFE
jgi:hypothetical protein